MQAQLEFAAEQRNVSGKGSARAARRAGLIPVVVYGNKKEPVSLSVEGNKLSVEYRKGGFMNKVVALKEGKTTYFAIAREIQLNPVSDKVEHADFMHVDAKSEVKVRVPLHFLNSDKSVGLKRGGVLNMVRRNVELLCNVNAIPKFLEVDIAEVNIGSSVHINDITLPAGVKPSISRNFVLCSITGRAKEEEETPAAAAAGAVPASTAKAPADAAKK